YTGNAFSWTGGSSVNNVEVYNTQTDTWSVRKAMPQAGFRFVDKCFV
ncbi:hypothetical protein GRP75_17655, partial [Paenibacillus sp. OT2-17]|nr:hypothetical protein [Paenibacillus sp. OT2-17]